MKTRLKSSSRIALVHFFLSLIFSGFVGLLILIFWFPFPYYKISGGLNLFILILIVDITCGPFLSFIVFNDKKSRLEKVIDLSLIGLIQFVALMYGVYTLALARPVYLVHEIDRFKVVTYSDIKDTDLSLKQKNVPSYSYWGIETIGVKVASPDDQDYLEQLELSLRGQDAALRVERWTAYENIRSLVSRNSKTIDLLFKLNPEKIDYIKSEINSLQHTHAELRWVPLESHFASDWVVVVSLGEANILKIINVGGY